MAWIRVLWIFLQEWVKRSSWNWCLLKEPMNNQEAKLYRMEMKTRLLKKLQSTMRWWNHILLQNFTYLLMWMIWILTHKWQLMSNRLKQLSYMRNSSLINRRVNDYKHPNIINKISQHDYYLFTIANGYPHLTYCPG